MDNAALFSQSSTTQDSPILEVELDVDEMVKNHKA